MTDRWKRSAGGALGAVLAVSALLLVVDVGGAAGNGSSLTQVAVPCTPIGVAVDPAANRVFVMSRDAARVGVYAADTLTQVASVSVSDGEYLALDAGRHRLYVSAFGHTSAAGSVTVIDTTTDAVLTTVPVGANPAGVAVDASTGNVYLALDTFGFAPSSIVRVYGTGLSSVLANVTTANSPAFVAVDSSSHRAYVANQGASSISAIDTTTNAVIASTTVYAPNGIAVDSTRGLVYVGTQSGTLDIVAESSNAVVGVVTVGSFPFGIAVDEASNTVYTANTFGNSLSIVDGGTRSEIDQIALPASPAGAAFDPATNSVYVASAGGCILTKIGRDTTPPVVRGVPDRQPNSNGWYSGDVNVAWQATDDSGSASDPPNTFASQEGTHTYTSDPSCDASSNCATGSIALSIDKTAPSAAITAPTDGATYAQGQVVSAAYSCSDGLSGVASCQGPVADRAAIDTSNGVHTFTVTATDAAGNQKSSTATYTVVSQLSDTTTCNGYFTGNGKDVVVPAGAVCHLLPGTSVKHDATVQSGGTLIANGVTVGHDLSMTAAGGSSICASNVGHDLTVASGGAGSGTILIGDTAAGCSAGNTVGHTLSVTGNADPVDVGYNSMGHDLIVQNNTGGGATVRNNNAGNAATCQGNNPQSGSGNTGAHGNSCPS